MLTADQLSELNLTLIPSSPFSAHLSESIEGESGQGLVKRLTRMEIEHARGAIVHPYVGPIRSVGPDQEAMLQKWLGPNWNTIALPAWDTVAVERDDPNGWVPRAWIGRTADEFIRLMNQSGNAGPLRGAALAELMTGGQTIGITQHVAADSSGRDVYLWSYIYRGHVGRRLLTTLLAICQADLVTMSDDERDLRRLEQQLTRAWLLRDRVTIERILAPVWAMTKPDGQKVSRAAALGSILDSNVAVVEAITTDDDGVTVNIFDSSAVVRGRTVATTVSAGVRQTSTLAFTDFFLRRNGVWQAVASHQSLVRD